MVEKRQFLLSEQATQFFCGIIFHQHISLDGVLKRLIEAFGPISLMSDIWPFTHIEYYFSEMGRPLFKVFAAFSHLQPSADLPHAKNRCIQLEQYWKENGNRRVNLDIGYLTDAKVVLATTKNQQHRLFLGNDIFGEVTLKYQRKSFGPYEWTYPDFCTEAYIDFFNLLRNHYFRVMRGVLHGKKTENTKTSR